MATLAERIKLKQAEVRKLQDDLAVATKALDEAAEDGMEAALATIEELTEQLEAANKALQSLERAEKALMNRAVGGADGGEEDGSHGSQAPPVTNKGNKAPAMIQGQGRKSTTPIWLRHATCAFLSHVEKKAFAEVMEERYAGQKDFQAVLEYQKAVNKTAVGPATTFTAGWAAELVQDDVRGFLQLLSTTSMAAGLAVRAFNQSFDGFNSVSIPYRKPRAANNNLGGAFVGEGGAIPLGRIDIGSNKIERYKMGVITTFTEELQDRSTPAIENVLREAILEDTSIRLDSVVFGSGAAVAGVQPAGLYYGVTPLTGTPGGGPDAVIGDLRQLAQALAPAGKVASIVVFMNDQDALAAGLMQNALGELMFSEIQDGRILMFYLIVSENQPQGSLGGVVAANIATAFDMPDFNVNNVATVVEANADVTAPTHATDAAGTIGVADQVPSGGGIPVNPPATGAAFAGATARSLWQTYSVGIRTIVPASWGMIRAGSSARVDGLTW